MTLVEKVNLAAEIFGRKALPATLYSCNKSLNDKAMSTDFVMKNNEKILNRQDQIMAIGFNLSL